MMFPMIPQYFFNKPVECSTYSVDTEKNSVKVKKKCRIIVSSVVEADVESENIAVDELLDAVEDELEEVSDF